MLKKHSDAKRRIVSAAVRLFAQKGYSAVGVREIAEAAGTTQRAISYYETEAGFPPAPAVIDLAQALSITTDELLGVKPPRVERVNDDSDARRMWKRFQLVSTLPERDRKAIIRLVNSLIANSADKRRAVRTG